MAAPVSGFAPSCEATPSRSLQQKQSSSGCVYFPRRSSSKNILTVMCSKLRRYTIVAFIVLSICTSAAAAAENQSLYLAGRVLSVDERDAMLTVTVERNDASPPPALARFAVPKTNDRATQDDAVWMLGSAKVADRTVARWRVEVANRATLGAWSVAPIRVGDTLAVVGFAVGVNDKGNPRDTLQAHYLIGNGKVVPLRAFPR